ncbi:anthranilate synthase component I family protein [Spirilliplanes yamanashiensis]|uniref:Anthranilate synthase component 1 n=2 Tax=Spirilliplanes yamanashiensis TaxID=42233 RepID=A0A8J4DHZ3_9ACTN|nr:anthranilate synthase component I family protein [Spirilliplanes yamanashiensis]GIJ01889.1 anthranilate synthase component I [Spirilliplanes yamanashiensis]
MPEGAPIPVTNSRTPLNGTDPFAAFLALRAHLGEAEVFLLESLDGPAADRRSAVVPFAPLAEVTITDGVVAVSGDAVVAAAVERAGAEAGLLRDGRLTGDDALWPFLRAVQGLFAVDAAPGAAVTFGFLAFFGYDTVRYIERLPRLIPGDGRTAEVTLVLPRGYAVFDLRHGSAELVLNDAPGWAPLDAAALAAVVDAAPAADASLPEVPAPLSVHDSTDPERFAADVDTCLRHIAVGDIYQVQIGHEISTRSAVDELTVYRRLRLRNPSPYMCLLPLAGCTVIGASPELFVRVEGDAVSMRPIAGTAPRGAEAADNAQRVAALSADEKEIAEHVMLVDLCRNDLAKFSRARTVTVDEMLAVQDFSHVFHLVSTVSGRRADGVDAYDVIAATFPAGTMTGTPKIRAMEIIESIETSRRGLYAGVFGLIDFGGRVNLGLCIRTVFRRGDTYTTRASAGVVADSKASSEWRETLAKMSAGHWAVSGQELL